MRSLDYTSKSVLRRDPAPAQTQKTQKPIGAGPQAESARPRYQPQRPLVEFVVSQNLKRRHLTNEAQPATLAVDPSYHCWRTRRPSARKPIGRTQVSPPFMTPELGGHLSL
jgi:hypothetical protein